MTKIRFLSAFAVAALMASPALASEQAEAMSDTTQIAGEVTTAPTVTRVAASATTGLISGRVSAAVSPGGGFAPAGPAGAPGGAPGGAAPGEQGSLGTTSLFASSDISIGPGMSAGGGDRKIGVWVNGSFSDISDDLTSTAFDGSTHSIVGGADYQITDRLLAGVALGYENTDVDTTFNTGNLNTNGFTIAPYAGFVINRYFSFDLSGGYTTLNTDLTRTNPISGATVTGDMDAHRVFGAANLNAYYRINRITLSGRVGYLRVREFQDSFTESDTTFNPRNVVQLGQIRASAQVGMVIGRIEPFISGRWEYDQARTKIVVAAGQEQPDNDRSGVEVGGGIRFALSDRITGSLEGSTHLARDNFDSSSFSGSIRIKF